ncbi:SDR family oxidoreductase [Bacillus bombysepticus]|uniref:SDR family NAD(P)-dependent oxidoreductase n=1 Tax=Bacillus bombysepticus TaxID=658666 RepID=UPI003017D7C9
MSLKNKVAVVTGGASGIGRATSIKLASEGAKVIVADFNESEGAQTVETILKLNGEAVFKKADVSKPKDVEDLVEFTIKTFGSIDIMFNNAGIGVNKPLLEHDPKTYHKVIGVNQHGVYYGIYYAAQKMQELGINGVIINTASAFGYMAALGTFGYHASKGAVVMMTKSAALELAPYNIRVVGIAPGFVDTGIIKHAPDNVRTYLSNLQMGKELMTPEDIANTVSFLASEESKGINGQTLHVDDGYTSFKSHIK